jgi:WD40 repeat protein
MMRDDAIKFDKGPDTAANDLTRVRVGRTRISLGNPGWIGLLLASLIVLPCLPIPRPVPEFTPTSWARGSGEPLINRFAYSPDGQRFVTTYLDGRAALWTLTNQHYNMRILDSAGYAHTVAFSSDGQCVFLGGAETDVVVCDVRRPGAERTATFSRWSNPGRVGVSLQ